MFVKLLLISYVFGVIVVGIPTPAEDVDEDNAQQEHEPNAEYGYSFHKFSGPVSGEIKPIYVPDGQEGQKLDYYATPDYNYSYGVKDPKTGNTQEHQESRQGDAVKGQYSVVQADGVTRVVKYTADPKNGFQAIVEYH
ncbi:pupal cuticle protein Edg-84A-like isoform X2 [Atheta coriaria]|uniref:pupal cuticle protein Edg-84A-like isoform X2 n=1 Tax=Dalotia coriaria TaxID=877792 RepID=UPI0031F34A66